MAGALLLLGGCMAAPAQREAEGKIDPTQACRVQCNRDSQVCEDQRSARSGNTTYGMGATCQNELSACLRRCGVAG